MKLLTFLLLLAAPLTAIAAPFPSAEEILANWQEQQKISERESARTGMPVMDYQAVVQLNMEAAQAWEKLLACNLGDPTRAQHAYLERSFRNCGDLHRELVGLHESIRQFAMTSEVRRGESILQNHLTHPLFVQILLEEAAKYTVVAVNEAPNKPKKIGICTGAISIGWCDYRQGEPRKMEMSREEKNIIESFRYLISDTCNLGLDSQQGYQVIIGIMNGFGVNVQNGNYVVIRHGNGVFFSPKSWAADGAFVMRGSYAEISFKLQENIRKNCSVNERNNDAGALERYSNLARQYDR